MTENSTGITNLTELKDAIAEANRCLGCKVPKCKQGCPISNDIPEFIGALARGDIGEARKIIARKSNLPAVCGRVCAHELQCEGHCVLNKTGKPIRVGLIERTIADFAFEMDLPLDKIVQKNRGKIGVIGSGPAGLTIAGDLAKMGFDVSVYEALDEPGGILLYGIPSFRLSKKIVRREVQTIEMLGVKFHTGCVVGENITVDNMFDEGIDAIFIGSGTAVAKDLDLPGRTLSGIIQSSYLLRMNYLYRSNQINRDEIPLDKDDEVLIIGAGNVGMDAARTAKQLGVKKVTVVYHDVKEKMSALKSEYEEAVEDGVEFLFENSIYEYVGEEGNVTGIKVKTPDGESVIAANKVFLAVGSRPANRIVSTTDGIDVDDGGYVITRDRPYGMTTRQGVFAGGDVVHQPATVVLAMKEAKRVAMGIAEYVDAVNLLRLVGKDV